MFLSSLILMLSTRILKIHDTSYKTAIKIPLIIGILSFIFSTTTIALNELEYFFFGGFWFIILSQCLELIFVKKIYKCKWKKTFSIWSFWLLFKFLFYGIIILIVIGVYIFLISAYDFPIIE